MPLLLYEIFWSHFCEKAAWCLDFKGLAYARVRVNPFTRREVRSLGKRGDVPVLKDGDRVVEGSGAIAAYLEARDPVPPLVPADPAGRAEVLAIQKRCDDVLGPDARCVAYHVALDHTALLEGTILFTRRPLRWLNAPFLRVVEPRLRRKFSIFENEVEDSRGRLRALLLDLQARLAGRGFLVGERPTLADIAAASLMDPLEIVPEFVRDPAFAPLFGWKRRLAHEHHRPQRSPWMAGPPPPGYPCLESRRADRPVDPPAIRPADRSAAQRSGT